MEGPGLIVAPLTPFNSELNVDEPRLHRQIDYVIEDCRATMVVAAGVETPGIHLSCSRRAQGPDSKNHRICRRACAGDGRNIPSRLEDGHRARA
jgi:hypothetical protein